MPDWGTVNMYTKYERYQSNTNKSGSLPVLCVDTTSNNSIIQIKCN